MDLARRLKIPRTPAAPDSGKRHIVKLRIFNTSIWAEKSRGSVIPVQ
jgi:hypothetical protein